MGVLFFNLLRNSKFSLYKLFRFKVSFGCRLQSRIDQLNFFIQFLNCFWDESDDVNRVVRLDFRACSVAEDKVAALDDKEKYSQKNG